MLIAPARPAFLLFVAFFPTPPFAVNFLLKVFQSCQIRLAPEPHGPAVTYAQRGGFKLFGHNPAVQCHYRNSRCFGGLLRVAGLYHNVIYITHLSQLVKLVVLALSKSIPAVDWSGEVIDKKVGAARCG